MVSDTTHLEIGYRKYWIAWLILLAITLTMIFINRPGVLIAGMTVKSSIIALWFMHLKYERWDFALIIAVAILATSLLLFGLIIPDGIGVHAVH